MEKRVTNTIKLEGAKLIFKNFSGNKEMYNAEGTRNFGVIIPDEELANQLLEDGWKVKRLKPREGSDDPVNGTPYMTVKVKYGKADPIAILITSNGKVQLNEDTIGQLDYVSIKNVDLIIRPYNYPELNGRPAGVAAYLKSIYVEVNEDDFERKYGDIPWAGGEA